MSDNEIKVLLTAVDSGLQPGMAAGAEAVTTSTEAMAAAVQEAAVAIQEAQAAVAESIGTATQAVRTSMEETAAVITGTNRQTTESVAAEAAAFNAAVQAKIDAQVRLNTAFAGSIGSTTAIGEAEAALDQAMAAGAITASEYAAYIERLNLAEVELAASTEAATVATEGNTVAMVLNGSVARELGVMIGELARGNYTRLEGSTITLANRTGFLSTALNAVLSPLGLVTLAAGAVGYEVFEAGQKFDAMEGTVLATGEAAGYTAGQLIGMADQIGQASGDISTATEVIQQLAASGRFAGQDLQLVGQAAADMAQLTGQSVQSIIGQIEKLQEDPVRAVAKLNDQYHFLTVAQFQEIEAAQQSGDAMKAASIAYEAMADKMQSRTDELNSHANVLIRSWRELRTVWSESMTEMDHALGGGDDAYDLNEAKLLLQTLEKQKREAEEIGSSALPGITLEIQHQQNVVDALTEKFKKQADAAAEVGKAAQQSAAVIDAKAKADGGNPSRHADHTRAQADKDEFEQQRLQHTMSLAEERQFWEQKREAATAGTQAYRQAVQQILEIRQRQATASRAAARQEATDARHSANEQINSLEIVRSGTASNTAERIQADAAVLASATRLYGANSAQQKAALAQMLADEKAYDASVHALNLEKLQAAHDDAAGEIETKRQQYRAEYAEGQISAQQLLDLERQLAAQRLAIDTKYYQDKARLDAADPIAVTRDDSAMVKAQQSMQQALARAEQQFHANSLRSWKEHARKIEGAMQGAINGMLFQHQTLRRALANIALVIGEDFIQQAVIKPLDGWIMGEATKTAATEAGAASRMTIEATAAATTKAADAATGRSQITSAAATGAAKAYQAIVGIPYVGPVLAPIAAGVAFAGIEAFAGQLASARGGWDRVPFDGAMTELHKDEMVLPADIANPMRKMAQRGGGAGDGVNVTIHATDSRSVKELLRREKGSLAGAMKLAARRGHFGGKRF
ncbi:MAG: phage tail length tape measure family protein [Dyella sp.]|uniref:phage tail length tape measure family protein n=1 Tax=Dyella sp. TaxID=1869338 RepID=UPI003F819C0F